MKCDDDDDPEPPADTVSTDIRWKNFDHSDCIDIHSGLVEQRYRDTVSEHETETYRPVAELIKETNRMHQRIRHADWTKPLAAKSMIRHADRAKPLTAMSIAGAVGQGQSLKVSQMKKAFDGTKKPAEKPPEPELKKGKKVLWINVLSVYMSPSYQMSFVTCFVNNKYRPTVKFLIAGPSQKCREKKRE
jgi:hypothetical protein